MSDFVMTIAGEAAPTEGTFGVRNPATGEVFAQAPECTRQQLDAAFDAAAKAARDWKADEAARRAVLLQAADVLMASTAELAPVLTAEQGKPLSDAGIEVFASAIWSQYFANLDMPHRRSSRTTTPPTWSWRGGRSASWPPSRRGTSR